MKRWGWNFVGWSLAWGCCGERCELIAGAPLKRTQAAAVAPAATIQLIPTIAFFRVGEAAREAAIRDEAYRAGYAQARADAAKDATPTNDTAKVSDAAKTRDAVKANDSAALPSEARLAAEAVLKRACVRCHAGAAAKGAIDLTQPEVVTQRKLEIFKAAYTGSMPPNAASLSDDEVRVLLEFLIADDASAGQ